MDEPAVHRLSARRRALAVAALLLAVGAAFVGRQMRQEARLVTTFQQSLQSKLVAFDQAILAMEMSRSMDDVRLVVGDSASDARHMAAIQRKDYVFIALYTLLFVALAVLGGLRARDKRRGLFILAVIAAVVAAFTDVLENRAILAVLERGGTDVAAIVRLALIKWTAVYVTAGLIGLLFMTSHFRATQWPRWLLKAGGNLLFLGAVLGAGLWISRPFVTLGLWPIAVGSLLLLLVAARWPAMLDDPEPPKTLTSDRLDVSKADHLLPLAQAALEQIEADDKCELAIAFREWSNHPGGVVPRPAEWELMADFLVQERPKHAIALARGKFRPQVIDDIAHQAVAALRDQDPSRRDPIAQTFGECGVDISKPDAQQIFDAILVRPALAARLAERLGVAVPFALAQQAELDEIRQSRVLRTRTPDSPSGNRYAPREAFDLDLMGLAFSGGGIRSATFNLGVLQALAELRLLPRVDYLSTVSGGGYIGSWFASWIKRLQGGVEAVQKRLCPSSSPDPNTPSTRPVRFLREYSRYLTPESGLLNADTWTLAAIWCRNTVLVQSVLVLTLATALLLALNVGILARVLDGQSPARKWMVGAIGLYAFFILCLRMGTELARFVKGDRERVGELDENWAPRSKAGLRSVQGTIVGPGFLCTLLLGVCLWSWAGHGSQLPDWVTGIGSARLATAVIFTAVFALGLAVVEFRAGYARSLLKPDGRLRPTHSWLVVLMATVGPAVVAAVFTMGVLAVYARWDRDYASWHVVALGPPMMAAIVGGLLIHHVGLLGRAFDDDRREWLSRLTAWLFIWCAGWLMSFGFAIYSPWLVGFLGERLAAAGGLAWLGTTLWGAYLGQSGSRNGKPSADAPEKAAAARKPQAWTNVIALAAPYLFVVGLVVGISFAVHALIGAILDMPLPIVLRERLYWEYISAIEGPTALLLMLVLAVTAAFLAWRIDVNEFSMHHLYKNRLVRCYLGASREGSDRPRHPHPFTGFDRDDDLGLATLRTGAATPYVGPLPVICTALNLVKGDDLAWQERKAQSFVFTPLFSGFEHLPTGRRATQKGVGGELKDDGLRPTCSYAYPSGGVRLGTAMAISGAAANPNMGYHSSPATSFLLTMFNVRLGWWMGNPRHERKWRKSSPEFGLSCLMNELTGNTTNHSAFVNLSDGGHFENLGVYELVRRRCRFVVACDAEQDGDFTFAGLGNLVRKCRTDFGVRISFSGRQVFEGVDRFKKVHFALGEIRYPGGECGRLLYVKSSLSEEQTSDLLEYSRRVKAFPHESTADQWFDESQFESYRQLGQALIHWMLAPGAAGLEKDPDCWQKVFDQLLPPSAPLPPLPPSPPS